MLAFKCKVRCVAARVQYRLYSICDTRNGAGTTNDMSKRPPATVSHACLYFTLLSILAHRFSFDLRCKTNAILSTSHPHRYFLSPFRASFTLFGLLGIDGRSALTVATSSSMPLEYSRIIDTDHFFSYFYKSHTAGTALTRTSTLFLTSISPDQDP